MQRRPTGGGGGRGAGGSVGDVAIGQRRGDGLVAAADAELRGRGGAGEGDPLAVVVDLEAHGGERRELDDARRLEIASGGEGERDGLAERGRRAVGTAGGDHEDAERQREGEELGRSK